jgi:tetratricopeptide (TPR) repeat protein
MNKRPKPAGHKQTDIASASSRKKSNSSQLNSQMAPSRRTFWMITGCGSVLVLLVGVGLLANRWFVDSKVNDLMRDCNQAVKSADWPTLERLARQWAVLEPESVKPWTMAASASRAMGDLGGCAQYLSQLPDSAPVEAFHELSLLQMESLVQPLAARDTCVRTLRIYPDDRESSLRLLFIHSMLCHRDKVVTEVKRAVRAGADTRATYAYLFTANWITFANGSKLNQFWIEQDPENEDFLVAALTHEALYRVADNTTGGESSRKDSELPEINLQTRIDGLRSRFPNNIELRMIEMSKHLQAGQVDRLGELLESPTDKLKVDNRYWRYQGWFLASHEQWSEAIDAYNRALTLCPVDFSSQNELAAILRRTRGPAESQSMQTKANLGIELELAFLKASNFESVSQTDYGRLADYLELCGETDLSNGLRKHLR